MTVIKRGKRWRALVKVGREVVASRTFDLKRDAQAWHDSERLKYRNVNRSRISVDSTVESWFPAYLASRDGVLAETTLKNDKYTFGRLPDFFVKLPVLRVKPSDIQEVYKSLFAKGLSHSSVKRFRGVLSSFFSWLVTNGICPSNPVLATSLPRGRRRHQTDWTAEALDNALKKWRKAKIPEAEIVLFLARTGLRWSEARALLVSDVVDVPFFGVTVSKAHPESARKVKGTKSGECRLVPITDDLRLAIESWIEGKSASDLLLPPMWRSRFIARLDWSNTVPGLGIHGLRRFAISTWFAQGVPASVIQRWAGHSNLKMTAHYAYLFNESAREAEELARLNARFGVPQGVPNRESDNVSA